MFSILSRVFGQYSHSFFTFCFQPTLEKKRERKRVWLLFVCWMSAGGSRETEAFLSESCRELPLHSTIYVRFGFEGIPDTFSALVMKTSILYWSLFALGTAWMFFVDSNMRLEFVSCMNSEHLRKQHGVFCFRVDFLPFSRINNGLCVPV